CSLQPWLAAGGEPAHLVLNGGRDLKQRRIGLFWSLPAFHRRRGLLKRLVLHCQVCGRELSQPIHGSTIRFEVLGLVASPSCDGGHGTYDRDHFERAPPQGPFGGCYDRT